MFPDWIEWVFLGLSPFLALSAALGIFNAVRRSQIRNRMRGEDHRHNMAYQSWCEWGKAQGGIKPVGTLCLSAYQDPYFALEHEVSLFEPLMPHPHFDQDSEPHFDTPCGMFVGEGWSVLDCFDGVRFVAKGSVRVMARALVFDGVLGEVRIPLDEIHTVVAACSSLLVGAASSDRPFLFGGVNGQKLRDIISFLLEAA